MIKALKSGKAEGLEPYIHPRNPIKVTVASYEPGGDKSVYRYGWAGFMEEVQPRHKTLSILDLGCNDRCCVSSGPRGDMTDAIDEVCFDGSGDVLFVSSFTYAWGDI